MAGFCWDHKVGCPQIIVSKGLRATKTLKFRPSAAGKGMWLISYVVVRVMYLNGKVDRLSIHTELRRCEVIRGLEFTTATGLRIWLRSRAGTIASQVLVPGFDLQCCKQQTQTPRPKIGQR